jgi:hypothetical protein
MAEDNLAGHDLQGTLEVIVQNTGDHAVSLVNQLSESLFLLDGTKDHLMLTLFAHIFD